MEFTATPHKSEEPGHHGTGSSNQNQKISKPEEVPGPLFFLVFKRLKVGWMEHVTSLLLGFCDSSRLELQQNSYILPVSDHF
jgi:hypothetical protein